jgi:hypothetical protein
MNNPESGFRPDEAMTASVPETKVEVVELSPEEEIYAEERRQRGILLEKAKRLNLSEEAFVQKMMTGEIAHDPEDVALVMGDWSAEKTAEFNTNPETQSSAMNMALAEISANRLSSAFGIIDRFQIPDALLATEEMQGKMKDVSLAAMTRGDSSGAVQLVKRCKIDDAFLRSDEMRQAALVCRDILAKKTSASVVARRKQLEVEFNLPPLE